MTETGLIARMARRLGPPPAGVVGIGDDAAVLPVLRGRRLLFASDMIVEGVHFNRRKVPAAWIGWKALACNISDMAAMGAIPRWAVVSLGLPRATPAAFVERLYAGLRRCAKRFNMSVVGGDTVRAPRVIVDVAILGEARPSEIMLRSGARTGDQLFVTGRLGGSLRSGRHARFLPRVREARILWRRAKPRAMMDLSDGLAQDLWRMSRASRVRLQIEAARIPVARGAGGVHHALTDGEDFELLFAVTPRNARRVPRRIGACPVTRIGRATGRGVGVSLREADGRVRPLRPDGFKHFG